MLLSIDYRSILARFTDLTIEDFGIGQFAERAAMTNARSYAAEGHPDFARITLPDSSFTAPLRTRA